MKRFDAIDRSLSVVFQVKMASRERWMQGFFSTMLIW